jgi:hypothetical protein
MNWQDDPVLLRERQKAAVRGRLLRSTLLWGPPFLASVAAFLFFAYDRAIGGSEYGSTWFLVVVLAIFVVLFGFQAIQSFLDYIGEPVSKTGLVTRRWARNDSLVIKSHYIRVEKMILRGDQLVLDGIREGDWVEATFYPKSAVLIAVEKRERPADDAPPPDDAEARLKL